MNTGTNLENIIFEQEGLALDLDETLSNTVDFWVGLLQNKFGNPENLTPAEIIDKYTYTQNVPYWQAQEALEYMEKLRNNNDMQKNLPLIKDSNLYSNKIHREIIPIVAYITVRPQTVKQGTEEWLIKNQFPEAHIILKPKDIPLEKSSKWKAETLESLYPKVKGIVDDNLSLPKLLSPAYRGNIFVLSAKPFANPNNISAVGCKDWVAVYEAVKQVFRR